MYAFFSESGNSPPLRAERMRFMAKKSSILTHGGTSNIADGLCEPLLTSKEASAILKIHPKVLERKAKAGEIPALKVGKFWRYRASALDAWIQSGLKSSRQACCIRPSF